MNPNDFFSQDELPEGDGRDPMYSAAYENLSWFNNMNVGRDEIEGHSVGKIQFPCLGARLEEYVVNIEKTNFRLLLQGLLQPLTPREVFCRMNRQQVESYFRRNLKQESIPEDKSKFKMGVERLLASLYEEERRKFFQNREIRILLNQYKDASYMPFELSDDLCSEEQDEFERQRIVHGLREHVKSCETCGAGYDEFLERLANDEVSSTIPGRKRKKLIVLMAAERIDSQFLRIYRK